MSIENSLERIASALESIAKSKAIPVGATTEASGTVAPLKPRPGKKEVSSVVEEMNEQLGLANELIDEIIEEERVDPDLKWPDINKKLFAMLGEVRDINGTHKEVCAKLMKKYSGGKPFSESSVKPSSYSALLADIEAELEALNG